MLNPSAEPEFTRPIVLEEIGSEGLHLEIEANPEECNRLTERLDLLALDRLAARLHVGVTPSGVSVKVSGRFKARFSQECVVSLEPAESNISKILEAEFGPVADETVISLAPDEPDPAEPLVDGRIDLGELVVQHLALALDPYPRKSGADLPDWAKGTEKSADSSTESPFAVLATLRKKE